jgi:uncharacterized protein YkwD
MRPSQWRGPRLAARASLMGLAAAGLTVMAIGLAALGAPASAAPAATTSGAFLPLIFVPPKPTPTGTPVPVTPPAASDWQSVLRYYRASAHLPTLAVNPAWSSGAANHAHYMVGNDVLANSESPATPFYTAAGATEAAASNLLLSDNVGTTDQQALDFWMARPFHALGLLSPALRSTGFGSYREDEGPFDPYRMGAVADVRQGVGAVPASVSFPIRWPDQNSTVYLSRYDGGEQPDPLTSCPGYSAPSGLPIIFQAGQGGSALTVGAHSLRQGNTELAHCAFTSTSYTNSLDPALESLGRQILAARDAIVLIPQQPLTPGLSYSVSIVVNGQTSAWTFHIAP